MQTIDDLRKPSNDSGFRNVQRIRDRRRNKDAVPFVGRIGAKQKGTNDWYGPRRATAEEAAQDVCDYLNGNQVDNKTLNYVGHITRSNPRDLTDAEVAARKLLREARADAEGRQGYTYLIGIKGDYHLKIGYSIDPKARVGELQTGNPRELVLLSAVPGPPEEEKKLHQRFILHNTIGEWFGSNETNSVMGLRGLLEHFSVSPADFLKKTTPST